MIQAFNDLDAVIVKQKAPKKDKKDPKKPKPAAPRAIGIVAPTMPPAKVPIATLEVVAPAKNSNFNNIFE